MNLTVILTWEQVLAMSPSFNAVNKTLAFGTLLDSDEGQGSVLLSNLEGLSCCGSWGVGGSGAWVVRMGGAESSFRQEKAPLP